MEFIFEIFRDNPRQGPGTNESTAKAFSFLKNINSESKILDIGCGSGVQTIKVAQLSGANVIATDVFQPYLDDVKRNAKKAGLAEQVDTRIMSMDELDFPDNSFDVIWSEGSIFIIGFENGLKSWRRLIKDDGYLIVSEMAWFRDNAPEELKEYWEKVVGISLLFPEEMVKIAEKNGYQVINNFSLPKDGWWTDFYIPLEKRLTVLEEDYSEDKDAMAELEAIREEIEICRKYGDYYGYQFLILQKK